MAKQTKSKKKGQRQKRTPSQRTPARVSRIVKSMGLDQAAQAWRHLLMDPCGASIVPSCFSGGGTGYYIRTRSFISPGNNVAGIYHFLLGQNAVYNFATTTPSTTSVAFSAPAAIFANGNVAGRGAAFRCLAGCVKVKYLGSESSRSGLIGLATGVQPIGESGQTFSGTFISSFAPNFAVLNRTGEVQHEAKWIPAANDETFSTVTATVAPFVPPGGVGDSGASSISVYFESVPANSLTFEVTAVYEYDPTQATGTNAVVNVSVPPKSNNTLNQVLRSLGPATSWAYNTLGAPVLKAATGYASNVLTTAAAQYNAAAPLLTFL